MKAKKTVIIVVIIIAVLYYFAFDFVFISLNQTEIFSDDPLILTWRCYSPKIYDILSCVIQTNKSGSWQTVADSDRLRSGPGMSVRFFESFSHEILHGALDPGEYRVLVSYRAFGAEKFLNVYFTVISRDRLS